MDRLLFRAVGPASLMPTRPRTGLIVLVLGLLTAILLVGSVGDLVKHQYVEHGGSVAPACAHAHLPATDLHVGRF